MVNFLDTSVIALYFVAIFGVAWYVTYQSRKRKEGDYDTVDYFLGGKSQGWLVVGASLFASNIGSEHLVGLAGSGARGNMPAAQFELLAAFILLILGWLFVPLYIRSGVFTMPEFLQKRYSRGARNYLSVISIIAYILTKISITIFAGALVFEVLGVPFWTGAIIVVLATGLYTVLGGLKAVLYTDLLQMVVLLVGSIAITFYGISELGGFEQLLFILKDSSGTGNTIGHLNLWRSMSDPEFPWTGIIFGAPILGIWYWCTDQYIVQRVLAAKDVSEARKGTIFGGFLKILPLFIFVLPGVIAFALFTNGSLDSMTDPDQALPALITNLLPSGLKGLVLAGLLAALMSSLSSVFNSCSTLITLDIYKQIKPTSKERELVFIGQIATGFLVVISLLWIPFMRSMMEGSGLYSYLQSIQAYISPPIAAVFLFGIFNKKLNAKGALTALWSGFALGIGRLMIEFLVNENIIVLGEGSFLQLYIGINFLHFALFLFIVCSIILFAFSYISGGNKKDVEDITFSLQKILGGNKWKLDLSLSLILILVILIVWLVFSPWGIA